MVSPSWEFPLTTAILFFSVLNWNPASIPDYDDILKAAVALKYDTVWTRVRPYATAGVSMSKEQHDALHSQREGSKSDHPHSFVWHPVHEKINDVDSPIVAVIGAGLSFDIPLRGLLPDQVSGIYAVISNNCNQSYTYLLDGPDALYIGEGDIHDMEYESDGAAFDLSLGTNPEFNTTPGHCRYRLVSAEELTKIVTCRHIDSLVALHFRTCIPRGNLSRPLTRIRRRYSPL